MLKLAHHAIKEVQLNGFSVIFAEARVDLKYLFSNFNDTELSKVMQNLEKFTNVGAGKRKLQVNLCQLKQSYLRFVKLVQVSGRVVWC